MIYTSEKLRADAPLDYRKFFMDTYPGMVSFASRFVDRDTAEDITQDSYIALWEKRHTLMTDNLVAFLMRTIQNRCLNHLKHKMVKENFETEARIAQMRIEYLQEADDTCLSFTIIEQESLSRLLCHAIRSLTPEKCARACELYYFHNRSVKEIAEIMQVSPRTVEGYLYNGVNILRKRLKGTLLPLLFLLLTF